MWEGLEVKAKAYATMASVKTSSKKGRSSGGRVLEKVDRKECIDDTIPLAATILTYKILQSHVVSG